MTLRAVHEITGNLIKVFGTTRKLDREIKCLAKKDPQAHYRWDPRSRMSATVLLRFLRDEDARRKSIEDKAKINVLGVTLAFSVMFASVALLSSRSDASGCDTIWLNFALIPLSAGGVFLLMGGWLALRVLRIAAVYVWTLEDEDESGAIADKGARILWYIELNRKINTIKSNHVVASYGSIRNGIVLLAIATIVLAVDGLGVPWT